MSAYQTIDVEAQPHPSGWSTKTLVGVALYALSVGAFLGVVATRHSQDTASFMTTAGVSARTFASVGSSNVNRRVPVAAPRANVAVRAVPTDNLKSNAPQEISLVKELSKAAAPVAAAMAAGPAVAMPQEVAEVALEVNVLGLIATALFIIIPTAFLLTLYIKSASEGNVSGGFSQKYYDESKGAGKKKTLLTAVLKGKGEDFYAKK